VNRAVKKLSTIVAAGFVFVLIGFVGGAHVYADRTLVNDPETMGGSNGGQDIFAEISVIRNGNYLDTPQSFAKLSYTKASGNKFRIGYCRASTDRNCDSLSQGGNIRVEVCPLNANENGVTSCTSSDIINTPAAGRDITIPRAAVKSNINSRYNYRVKVYFLNSSLGQPIISFRLRALNGTAGFFNHRAAGGTSTPIAIQNRNTAYNKSGATWKDNLTVRFRIPCISNVPTSFIVRWKDADATPGSKPYNPDINWTMTLKDGGTGATKATVSSANYAGGNVPNYMGGQDQDRDQTVNQSLAYPYAAGDVVEWKWNNVLANNGVQFEVPFDDANIRNDCTSAESDKGECSVSAPERLAIGEEFDANFEVSNTGTDNWSTVYTKLGSWTPVDNTTWGTNRQPIQGSGVVATAFGPILYSGTSTTWSTTGKTFKAPSTPGIYKFSWRILREGQSPVKTNIDDCSVDIKVYDKTNYPFVRSITNDVWAGSLFSQDTSGTCQYQTGPQDIAANAQIKTYSPGTLEDYERAVVTTGRLWRAVLGRQVDNSSGTTWINLTTSSAESDEKLVEYFLALAANDNSSNSTNIAKMSNNTTFVTQLYRNAFGREPDPSGLTSWVNSLNSGTPRQRVVNVFIQSGDNGPFSLSESGTNNYGGSGSEYGVFSTGQNLLDTGLNGFVGRNGKTRTNNGNVRYDLVFANDAEALSSDDESADGPYGTFSSQAYCLPNYYQMYDSRFNTINNPSNTANSSNVKAKIESAPAGQQLILKASGSITIPASSVPSGSNVVLVVDGDVTISGNIAYPSDYGSAAAPTVPKFNLIVKGNITINNTVSRLDGNYIAQPIIVRDTTSPNLWTYDDSAGAKGVIQTCSGSAVQDTPNGTCATSQLKVNGSFIARRLRLWRTFGTIGGSFNGESQTVANFNCATLRDYKANNPEGRTFLYGTGGVGGTVNTCAAELFNASPERYLGGGTGNAASAAQSYKELPPVY